MEALKQWLELTQRSQSWLADEIGVSRAAVSLWLSGHSEPSPDNYRALHAITNLPYEKLLQKEVA